MAELRSSAPIKSNYPLISLPAYIHRYNKFRSNKIVLVEYCICGIVSSI